MTWEEGWTQDSHWASASGGTGWVVSGQLSQGTGCVLFPLRRGEKWTLLVSLFLMCSVGSVICLVLGISREQGEPRSPKAPIRVEEADRGQSQ